MLHIILPQLIGAIGFILLSISYYKKEKTQILYFQLLSFIFITIHYYLLNGISGSICNFIMLLSSLSILLIKSNKSKVIISLFFILLIIIINIISFQNFFSIFPMIASIIILLSYLADNENIIRVTGFIAALCWLIYAIFYKSYIAIIFQIIILVNDFLSILKVLKK